MIQFYFLSIVLNLLGGYALVSMDDGGPLGGAESLNALFRGEIARLLLGVLSVAVGFFKLLTVVRGDVPVVGDLIPALAGLSVGVSLLVDYYKSRSTVDKPLPKGFELVFVKNRRYIGYAAMVAAALHFLFPTVLFL